MKPRFQKNLCRSLALLCLAAAPSGLSIAEPAKKLEELGITLSSGPLPVANYVPAARAGNMVYLAGAIAKDENGKFYRGKVGDDLTVDEGYEVARKVGISLISSLMRELGDLDKVKRIVRVEGFVNCGPDFEKQSLVINGCSDLLVEVFGEKGRHARIAIGASSLPFGAPVEISAIVEVED
ncbi:RidA family protein [Pelagicoccus albus]|uniref:RidA family protein n=1 Tax=Pelagicoccus albus TaxID=415222 RepID=A0A7X1B461_9BACT|nr:RidA family protein [Pelagicoccus albus]MBC2605311.1 RidA family protein [Pelagicoccus albus]